MEAEARLKCTMMKGRAIEIIDRRTAAVLREKTPQQRFEMAMQACAAMRLMIESNIRSSHPDWSELTVRAEIARRWRGGREIPAADCRRTA
jgi:hypothetical protein